MQLYAIIVGDNIFIVGCNGYLCGYFSGGPVDQRQPNRTNNEGACQCVMDV